MLRSSRYSRAKRLWGTAILLVILGGAVTLAWNWPLTRGMTVEGLEQFSLCRVTVKRFDRTYIPHPGYIAEEVTFTRLDKSGKPVRLAIINRLECKSTWISVLRLRAHAKELRISGLKVTIPDDVPPSMRLHADNKRTVTVASLIADGTELQIASSRAEKPPFSLRFPELRMTDLEAGKPVHLNTLVRNERKAGELRVVATIHVPSFQRAGETNVDGSFELQGADLRNVTNLEGKLEAKGELKGNLRACRVSGKVDVPEFGLISSGHQEHLTTTFDSSVNGLTGDVQLRAIEARFGQSVLHGEGLVSGPPVTSGEGKRLTAHLLGDEVHVEDLLRMFVKAPEAAVSGPMRLEANVVLPYGKQSALQRLQMNGDFVLHDATFNSKRQERVNELSARARGKKVKSGKVAEEVTSDLAGHVELEGGRAHLSSWRLQVPGATARGNGTFNVRNDAIAMRGRLAMQARLSKAVGGFKSIFLIPLDPFFRKDGAGAVLPFQISGSTDDPKMRLTLRDPKPHS